MDVVALLQKAAHHIRTADALLVTTGAGMGVDSGFGTFRGRNAGVWPPLQELGYDFTEMSNPQWFSDDPAFGWAFWHFRWSAYTSGVPHRGYHLLVKWGHAVPKGMFSFTSNIDGHWIRAGLSADRVLEVHGSVNHLQCAKPCAQEIWDTPKLEFTLDDKGHKVTSDLPQCPKCSAVARPNVLMFGDWGYVDIRSRVQEDHYAKWCKSVAGSKVVIVEIGAGHAVPTVRLQSEAQARRLNATLIRINLDDPDVPNGLNESFSLPLGALEALEGIEKMLSASAK